MTKRKNAIRKTQINSDGSSSNSNNVTLHLHSALEFPQIGESSSIQWSLRKMEALGAVEEQVADGPSTSTKDEVSQKFSIGSNEQNIKKSKRPILLDFSAFVKPKERVNSRKSILKSHATKQDTLLGGNDLDASNPVRKKGKYREREKIRLTVLKGNIIKERILKSISSSNSTRGINEIDIKKEILTYVDNLKNNKRIQNIPAKTGNSSNATLPDQESIFNSKFKWYCENIVSNELNEAATKLIKRLVNLQDRAFDRDPVRARVHKRFVTGLREAKKYLKLQKVKLLIIAPDLEAADPNGPLSLCVLEIKNEARVKSVPYAFALDRRKLGYCSLRKAPISVFAIMNYEGAEVEHEVFTKVLQEARLSFEKKVNGNNGQEASDFNELFQLMAIK